MFENLTPRERILALVIAALVPMALLMFVAFWFFGVLGERDSEISSLDSRIMQAENLNRQAKYAMQRRNTYREMSLPSDPNIAASEYKAWLVKLAEDTAGLKKVSPAQPAFVPVKFQRRKDVFNQMTIALTCEGTLPEFTTFLYEFHRSKMLHRISRLSISPLGESNQNKGAPNFDTGRMKFTMSVQTASLVEVDEDRPLQTAVQALPMTMEQYNEKILFRNIFGNPNEPPRFASSGKQSEYEGRDISFQISARDANPNDKLTIELLESEVADGQLIPSKTVNGKAQFVAGPQKPGEYKLKAKVTDTGCPPKSELMDIVLTIREKRVDNSPPKEKFLHVKETVIGGITVNGRGQDEVWVRVKTKGELHKLTVGGSFRVDDHDWVLKSVEGKTVSFASDGKIQWFKNGDSLDQPIRTEVQAGATKETETSKADGPGDDPKLSTK